MSRDIFDYDSIIVEVNLELRGFTKFMESSLPLHLVAQEWDFSYKFMPSGKKDKSLKKKYSSFISNRRDIPELEPESENSVEGIYSSLKEFKNSPEETDGRECATEVERRLRKK